MEVIMSKSSNSNGADPFARTVLAGMDAVEGFAKAVVQDKPSREERTIRALEEVAKNTRNK
jgi:hypothetical protein